VKRGFVSNAEDERLSIWMGLLGGERRLDKCSGNKVIARLRFDRDKVVAVCRFKLAP
jgi:hypothetical protein